MSTEHNESSFTTVSMFQLSHLRTHFRNKSKAVQVLVEYYFCGRIYYLPSSSRSSRLPLLEVVYIPHSWFPGQLTNAP